ncbi:uncharacterized protein [Physcomitrium patens]|uniref:Fatty acid desaturase domain-containing protein n=2 Tax=Physcomitrium patens TaxID=3218 RepID=A0A7I4F6H8_PHYPA|nr:omega-6 fatty acid desaturase, chloroplastic-like isoform X4 [Physcomitrium patens]|eukprot:XP_024397928.1 omega-6 fatty acid desaturase, chloroplastic-like isoform X4 [Physcomitrella patens]
MRSTTMVSKCTMGALAYSQVAALKHTIAQSSTMLTNPTGSRTLSGLSGLRGLRLSRRGPKNEHTRNLTIVATAAPLSRQFTSVPGFTQIGEPVPEGVNLSDVVKSLPKEVFEIDDVKAWQTVAITVGAVALGYAALAVAPWYLYPLVYAYLGTAMTGLFVVGHDCGHNSFSRSQLVNDIVGTVMFMPLIYPFEPWRIKHNTHHAHTNKLIIDTAWQPFRPYMYDRAKGFAKFAMEAAMGPLWWIASVGHWLFWHFDLSKYRPQDVQKVKVSLAAVAAFGVFVLLPLLFLTGPLGFVKWWVVPWLGYHFWMSTFTLVHHTAPHIPFKQAREWSVVEAQLNGTIHCEYPAWIEFLCHDISVHIPHHISSKIPSYNLRKAYASLQQNWDKHLNKAEFGVPLMTTIVTQCNLFDDKKKRWVKFDKALRSEPVQPAED